jgi:hypothetical protein
MWHVSGGHRCRLAGATGASAVLDSLFRCQTFCVQTTVERREPVGWNLHHGLRRLPAWQNRMP